MLKVNNLVTLKASSWFPSASHWYSPKRFVARAGSLGLSAGLLLVSVSTIQARSAQPVQDATGNKTEITRLAMGKPIKRTIGGDEKHIYRISLAAAQYIAIVVEQRGADVVVTLSDPEGSKLREVDSPNGTNGPEPLSWLVDKAGDYRLEVRLLDKNAAPGDYEVRISELRAGRSEDRKNIAVEVAMADGVRLLNQGTNESFQKSIDSFQTAVPLLRDLRDQAREALALFYMGYAHAQLDQHQKSLENYALALELRQAIGDRAGQAVTLNGMGIAYVNLGEKQKALDFYNQALTLHRAVGNQLGQAATLNAIAAIHELQGDKQKAAELYEQGLALYRAINNRGSEAATLYQVITLYRSMGESQKALELSNQALAVFEALADKGGQAKTLNGIGLIYDLQKDHRRAIEYYKRALLLSEAAGNSNLQATIYDNIGWAHDSLGEKRKAIEYYNSGLSLRRTVGDRKGEARTLIKLAAIHNSLKEKQKALELNQSAVQLFRALNERFDEGTTLIQIGLIFSSQPNHQKALEHFNQALTIFSSLGQATFEAITLVHLGLEYLKQNDRPKGMNYFERGLKLVRTTGEKAVEAHALTYLGLGYNLLGDSTKALGYYEQALSLHRSVGSREGEALTLNTMAAIYNSRGEKQKALEYVNRSLQLMQSAGDRGLEALTLANAGALYYWLGDKEKALDSLSKALPLFRATSQRELEIQTLSSLGFVYELKEDHQKARDYFTQALETSLAIGERDKANQAYALMGLGVVDLALGQHQKALESLNKSISLFRAVGYRFGEAYSLGQMGKAYFALGDKQRALESLNQALVLSREDKNRDVEGDVLPSLMALWRSLDKPRLAILYGKQAINVYQLIRSNIRDLDKGLQKAFVVSKEDTYRQLADLLITQGRLPEAQQVLGLLKEEEYFDFVRRDAAVTSLSKRSDLTPDEVTALQRYEAIADQISELANEFSELEAKAVPSNDSRYLKLKEDLRAATRTFQVFLRELETEFGEALGREKIRELQEKTGLQSDLPKWGSGVVVLHTIVGENNYRVILTTPTLRVAREAKPAIKGADLSRLVLEFRQAVQNPSVDPLPLAQKLYNILLGPVAKDLNAVRARTLVWSLDGTLRYLPIAALHDGRQYVVERYQNTIITLASLPRLGNPSGTTWRGLGLGVSKGVTKDWGSFGELPAVPDELRGIIRDENQRPHAAGGVVAGRVMLDEAFTEIAMETALRGGRYPLVHIASHFLFKPGNKTDSFLLLGDGNRLTLDKIEASPGRPYFAGVQLLTLSACDTATGGSANGREVDGFAVLAQQQGAEAVLATLWPVADRSTQELMRLFYRNRVTKAGTKAEALRQAQLSLLRGEMKASTKPAPHSRAVTIGTQKLTSSPEAPYAHPYFWAPFILIGNWR